MELEFCKKSIAVQSDAVLIFLQIVNLIYKYQPHQCINDL